MNQLPAYSPSLLAAQLQGSQLLPEACLNGLPSAVMVVAGSSFLVQIANAACCRQLQMVPADVLGKPLFSILPHWNIPALQDALLQATSGKILEFPLQVALPLSSGPLNLLVQPAYDNDAALSGIIIQLAPAPSEQKSNASISAVPGFTLLNALPHLAWVASPDGTISFYNEQASFFSASKTGSWHWLHLLHPQELDAATKAWQQAVSRGATFSQEHRLLMADGTWRWHCTQAQPQRNAATGMHYWVGTCTDIHTQKEAAQEQQEAENLVYTVLEASPNSLSMLDGEGRLLYINQNGQQLMEMPSLDAVKGSYWWELWDAPNREEVKEAMQQAMTGATVNFQAFCLTVKGTPKWWDVVVSAVPGTDGVYRRLLVIVRDITGQKEASERMHQLSRHLQLSTRAAHAGTWEVTTATQKLEWSALHKELWGYPEDFEGITPAHWQVAILPEDEPRVVAHFNQTEQQHLPVDVSYRIKRVNDGSIRWVRSIGSYTYNDAGEATSISGICLDITDQKLAEERLEQSEARFRRIFYNAPIAIWEEDMSEVKRRVDALAASGISNLDTYFAEHEQELWRLLGTIVVTDVNEAAQAMYGGTKQETIHCLQHFFIQRTLGTFLEELKLIVAGGGRFETETLVQNKWGEVLNVLVRIDFPADDQYNSIQVILIDITQRKKAEEKLRESESRFRILADTLPQLVWIMNANGQFEYASDAWLHYSGIGEIRAAWRAMIHPDDAAQMMPAWHANTAAGTPFRYELRLKHKDGGYRWHYSVAEPVKDEAGNVVRWIGAMTDIHAQKTFSEQLEGEVLERTAELHKVTQQLKSLNSYLLLQNQTFTHAEEASRQGSFFWSPSSGIVTYSDNLFRLLGCEPGSFEPGFQNLLHFVHPQDRKAIKEEATHMVQWKQMPDRPFRIVRPDGTVRHLQATGRTVQTDGEEVIIGTLRDVTEDVLLRQKLQANNLELERSNADLQQFAHVASHDLKEPVRKIRFFGSCLHSEFGHLLPDKAKQYLSKMESAATRMYSMVEGVLQYSALNNNASDTATVDLPGVLRSIEADLELMIREKEARLQYGALPEVQGHAVLIHQLFYNLINNALKFSRPGVPPVIRVSGVKEGQQVVIEVADNGIGFGQEHAQQIFKTFSRLNPKEAYEGTGLGLALCKKIAERHGGSISARGVEESGAVFTVVLPAAANITQTVEPQG
jgi:hypothetical protein